MFRMHITILQVAVEHWTETNTLVVVVTSTSRSTHGQSYVGAKLGSGPPLPLWFAQVSATPLSVPACLSVPTLDLYLLVAESPMTGQGLERPAATHRHNNWLVVFPPLSSAISLLTLLMLLCVVWVLLILVSCFLPHSSVYKIYRVCILEVADLVTFWEIFCCYYWEYRHSTASC